MVSLFLPSSVEYLEFVYFDRNERVIELPTLHILSLTESSRYSPKSIKHYSKVLKYYCGYIEDKFNTITVDEALITMDGFYIDRYLKRLFLQGLKPSTIRNRDATIKQFMEWLTTEDAGRVRINSGYIGNRYKSPNPSRNIPKFVTIDEVIQYINYFYDENQRCLFHFIFDTGLRKSEVPRMLYSDIPDLNNYPKELNYFSLEVRGSKGPGGQIKPRNTYISRAVIERINKLHNTKNYLKQTLKFNKEEVPLFLNAHGKPITINSINGLIRNGNQRSGMKMSAHKFRHGFAMSVLASEFNDSLTNKLVITKEALGHSDIKTTQVYTTIAPQIIQNIQDRNKENNLNYRFEDAQRIFESTFKPQKLHTEKRGHYYYENSK